MSSERSPRHPASGPRPTAPAYAELQVTSNFSFLRGASHPAEMVERASELGYRALALTDRNTLAGVVRAYEAARRTGLHFIPGARLDLADGPSLLCLPTTRHGYGALSRLITTGRRRAPKGECMLTRDDVAAAADPHGHLFIAVPPTSPGDDFAGHLAWYRDHLPAPLHLAATHYHRGDDDRRLAHLARLATSHNIPLVATGDVHQHDPARRRLHDTLTCIREHCTIDNAGWRLEANAERHLKSPARLARLFRDHPDALANTTRIADQCRFSLGELRYEYPDEVAADGRTPRETLAALTWAGAAERYPNGIPPKVRAAVEHELALIAQLAYEPYFLTVEDIVRKARELGILCQGRGSAANSAVCYCLGVTSVDPAQIDLLFERFISAERDEVPDIDVDFEHERREEVIQYIYGKYGRERAGLTATVITYRVKSALRDVGKAMGLSEDVIGRLLSMVSWRSKPVDGDRAREEGFDPGDRRLALTLELARELYGFPRHLSQHTGGFVISRGPLCEIVPIENAAMEDRTVIEWNKDDLEVLGLIKVDVLGLGMLTCIRKAFALIEEHYGVRYSLESVPREDPATYEMIQRGDTVGVFQIESRAQMAMLPRLRPATFYDLVIEVAIVRPGPIQGDMVHPYLRRRQGREAVEYPSEELRQVLRKTLGVPLFQEQVMRIAIVAAGFTPAEADQLRRAMASFRNPGTIHSFRDKFIEGMTGRGYTRDFAERCFRQIEGFGEYGFPESHAASFAHLAYVSSWLKCHYPAVFACALLNSQPMGFYAPAQIVRDARDHGVEVRPADVNRSEWDCTLEGVGGGAVALRLGLRRIRGLKEEDAEQVTGGRLIAGSPASPHAPAARGPYRSPLDLWRRTGVSPAVLTRLAGADAFRSMGLERRQAAWAVRAMSEAGPLPLFESAEDGRADGSADVDGGCGQADGNRDGGTADGDQAADTHPALGNGRVRPEPALPAMSAGEHVAADYRSTGLSLKHHPVALLRHRLDERGVLPAKDLDGLNDGDRTVVAGIVLTRQRPGKGIVMFVTLEDETGTANLVVFPSIYENQRRDTLTARLMMCRGKVQKVDGVIHVIAERVTSLNGWLEGLGRGDGVGGAREAVDGAVADVANGPPGAGIAAGRGADPGGSFVGRGRFFH
ncbi:MAG: error-prone DNA polymerase [Gemmatimonadota bacterium]|nr:error-prone DNA polymerase [Gemmatimonadota bacterium]